MNNTTTKTILREAGMNSMIEFGNTDFDAVRTSTSSFEKTVTFLKNDSTRVHIFIIATIEEEAVKFELFFFGANEAFKTISIPLVEFNHKRCFETIELLKLKAMKCIISPFVHELA
jgi:hypothetical protein